MFCNFFTTYFKKLGYLTKKFCLLAPIPLSINFLLSEVTWPLWILVSRKFTWDNVDLTLTENQLLYYSFYEESIVFAIYIGF